jgi:hypothetical protein
MFLLHSEGMSLTTPLRRIFITFGIIWQSFILLEAGPVCYFAIFSVLVNYMKAMNRV